MIIRDAAVDRESPLRVHAIIDSLGRGGAEFLLADLAAVAPSAGIDLSVAHFEEARPDGAVSRLLESGVNPVRIPVSSLVSPRDLRSVRRHLADVRPDVVHTHLGTSDWVAGLAARSLSLPAVSTVHVMDWERSRRNNLKVALMAAIRRRCMARVVAVSDEAGRWLLEHRWARREQLVTVHNGVAAEPRPGAGPRIRRELGLSPEELVVMMVSVLRPEKGHALGLAAVRALLATRPGVRLVIVGDGPIRGWLETEAAALGNRVLFTGHRDDVMEVLDAADILFHPSRVDAFPGSVVEALAAEVPVVATAVGGIPEIIADGVGGVLVEPDSGPRALADALERLMSHPDRRHAIAAAGRERFEREFTARLWALRMRSVYEQAIASDRRRSGVEQPLGGCHHHH
jgi:glycosyltransferase involved in cell wall biosynthesis